MIREPPSECPIEQRKLLIASGLFIEAMGGLGVPPANTAEMPTGEFILYAIWFRLLETARSIQQSCYAGYAREQQPVARSMVNSACDLMFIAEKETPSRALLWAYFSIERRKRVGKGYVSVGMVAQAQIDALEAEAMAEEESAIAELEAGGVKPYPKFNQNVHRPLKTWTGLSDADLIKKVGRNVWYEGFYVPFSDEAHGNVLSAVDEIHQLRKGTVIVGPRYSPLILFHVVMCVRETLARALETLDRHFSLGKASEIDAQDRTLLARAMEYQQTITVVDPAEL
jgi:hypothetical protein